MRLVEKSLESKFRILIVVPHFFNAGTFPKLMFGSHEIKKIDHRRTIVDNCKSVLQVELESLGAEYELIYLGIKDNNLVPLQVQLNPEDPRFLPWAAIDFAHSQIEKYDFICILEDDLELEEGMLRSIINFETILDLNTVLIPNRIEIFEGVRYCTDLIAMPGWKGPKYEIAGQVVREPINIHSGFLFMSGEKFDIAYKTRPFKNPTIIIGDYMASAFANIHANFRVLRCIPAVDKVTLFHHDNWAQRLIDNGRISRDDVRNRIEGSLLD
jgi:hypothetical protein